MVRLLCSSTIHKLSVLYVLRSVYLVFDLPPATTAAWLIRLTLFLINVPCASSQAMIPNPLMHVIVLPSKLGLLVLMILIAKSRQSLMVHPLNVGVASFTTITPPADPTM